jgi:2-polyprenyl-3-methyl-5-hydroxy-6-metoxy-1,4-benzoquinol methylase
VTDGDFPDLNDDVRAIWDANADFWNARMGEGNDFHLELIAPAQERLLAVQPGETILDIACGNGQFARRLTDLGARVVAADVSPRMIEIAKAHRAAATDRIEYRVIDATDRDALGALGDRRFDAAVCTMAMMDMASIEPLAAALARLLRPSGRFVFSVVHPCFNSGRVSLVAEEAADESGRLVRRYSVKMSEYIHPRPTKGLAMRGQPVPQYYFDRPISALLDVCFKAGFVLDGLEEPTFTASAGDGRPNWANITEIPPALVARMRLR